MKKTTYAKFTKVDTSLGLVFGFAIVCKEDGEDFFDSQGDHIPEDSMLKAASDFMQHSRSMKVMHDGDTAGSVVFAFPMTSDIADAYDIQTRTTGLMIAVRPNDPSVLGKYLSGEFTGFSIGGSYGETEVLDA